MAALYKSVVSLRIAGEALDPTEITRLLGAQPSRGQIKGQAQTSKSGTRVARIGLWSLEATATEPEDLNSQVAELLGRLTADIGVWKSIGGRFDIDLFCGWFMGGSNEGASISPETLIALGERGIELAIDLYAPSAGNGIPPTTC
jgi:hypothetical protein